MPAVDSSEDAHLLPFAVDDEEEGGEEREEAQGDGLAFQQQPFQQRVGQAAVPLLVSIASSSAVISPPAWLQQGAQASATQCR